MNSENDTITVDPVPSGSSFNLSLDVSTNGKKNAVHGTPMPLGLQPNAMPQVNIYTASFMELIPDLYLSQFKTNDSDLENYRTAKAHAALARETCDRARREYDEARDVWTNFKQDALKWSDFANKIHRTPEEDELISRV